MQELLREIKSVPSVMGSYVHITGIREANSDLPKIFLAKLKDIGEIFDRVIKVNLATNMQTSTIEFKFDEAIIFLRPIDQDSCLITFCEGNINKKMFNMTTGMLNNELLQAVAKARAEATSKPVHPLPNHSSPTVTAAASTAAVVTKKSIDVNKIIHAGPMAKIFQGFQDSLAMAIGPISEMVMKDAVEAWAQAGECSQERLPELVELLIMEIDDVSLEAEFKLAIKHHLH